MTVVTWVALSADKSALITQCLNLEFVILLNPPSPPIFPCCTDSKLAASRQVWWTPRVCGSVTRYLLSDGHYSVWKTSLYQFFTWSHGWLLFFCLVEAREWYEVLGSLCDFSTFYYQCVGERTIYSFTKLFYQWFESLNILVATYKLHIFWGCSIWNGSFGRVLEGKYDDW